MFNEALLNAELVAADSAAQQTSESFSEILAQGTSVAVVGIGIVFSILALLWIVLELFKLFFYVIPNRKAANAESVTEKAPAPAAPQPVVTAAPVQQSDDGALIAAITAAITAYRAAEGTYSYTGGFRVVSFKRK